MLSVRQVGRMTARRERQRNPVRLVFRRDDPQCGAGRIARETRRELLVVVLEESPKKREEPPKKREESRLKKGVGEKKWLAPRA